jgi:hypothetical protein
MAVITGAEYIDLLIPFDSSARFSAHVGNGSITISYLALQDQITSEGTVPGTLGRGQRYIRLVTGNGDAAVRGI